MSIIRLIHIKIDPSETEKATRIWKTECASLMIQQKGCVSEKLLRCRDAPEFISYSEWDSEAAIEAYRASAAHKEIVRHTRGLKGAKAEVKLTSSCNRPETRAARSRPFCDRNTTRDALFRGLHLAANKCNFSSQSGSKHRNRCRCANRREAKFPTRLRTWNGSQS